MGSSSPISGAEPDPLRVDVLVKQYSNLVNYTSQAGCTLPHVPPLDSALFFQSTILMFDYDSRV